MFINISNVPSKNWSKEQLEQAHNYGKLVDIAFQEIKPEDSDIIIFDIGGEIKEQLRELNLKKGDCVCIAGEYGITFDIVDYVHSCLNYVTCVYPVYSSIDVDDSVCYNLAINTIEFVKFRFY